MKIEKVHTCTGCGGKQKEWAKFCVNCGAPQPPSASASMSSLQIPGSAEKPTRRTGSHIRSMKCLHSESERNDGV